MPRGVWFLEDAARLPCMNARQTRRVVPMNLGVMVRGEPKLSAKPAVPLAGCEGGDAPFRCRAHYVRSAPRLTPTVAAIDLL